MAPNQASRDAHTIRRRLDEIDEKLRRQRDFREFGATTDLDYQMCDARTKALKVERDELKEILGDL